MLENNITSELSNFGLICKILSIDVLELMKALRMQRQSIRLWIRGKEKLPYKRAVVISEYFGIDINILVKKEPLSENDLIYLLELYAERILGKKAKVYIDGGVDR